MFVQLSDESEIWSMKFLLQNTSDQHLVSDIVQFLNSFFRNLYKDPEHMIIRLDLE